MNHYFKVFLGEYLKIFLVCSGVLLFLFGVATTVVYVCVSDDDKPKAVKTSTVFGPDFDPGQPGYLACQWNPETKRLDCMSLDHLLK